MVGAVDIPVTVKMRAGWTDKGRNAPTLARMVQEAGAAAITIHGRTAEQSYSGYADWKLVSQVAEDLRIPVFGSGDCVEPEQIVERMKTGVSGVLVGRGVLRNPWILAQAADRAAGCEPRLITIGERGQFLLDYIDLLLDQRDQEPQGFRHIAPGGVEMSAPARGHERWVINKLRALCAWYSKGLDSGSHLRVSINSAENVAQVRRIIDDFFMAAAAAVSSPRN
jgi:tRNA-dihydrouridine synthase B